jgi:hypothetical protein
MDAHYAFIGSLHFSSAIHPTCDASLVRVSQRARDNLRLRSLCFVLWRCSWLIMRWQRRRKFAQVREVL